MRKASDYEKTTVKVAVFLVRTSKEIGYLQVYVILQILPHPLC
ncbi:MAG: hypothetical protein K0S25_1355 [Bacillus sp. (in: firmicutes)]|jgi:hypothetical protein|nr:hypothetical protein [Bacillus sp. (in: firmicutes)]